MDMSVSAVVDIGSPISIISQLLVNRLKLKTTPTDLTCHLAFGNRVSVSQQVTTVAAVGEPRIPSTLTAFVSNAPTPELLLGRDILEQLPITLTFNNSLLFSGFRHMQPKRETPTHTPGDGIPFAGGSPTQQKQVRNLIIEHADLFFEYSGRYGLFPQGITDLPLTDKTPVRANPYRLGPAQTEVAEAIMQELLQRDLIEPSTSAYASPMFLVAKKCSDPEAPVSRRFRPVEDYRALNKKLQDCSYPVKTVQELLDTVGHKNVFWVSLDLRQAYHHCPLTQEAREITAFVTPSGHFQYKVLPFGLKTAPRLFQRVMERILAKHLRKHCVIYLDDILIYGQSFEALLDNLKQILTTLQLAGASLNLTKCKFLAQEVEYLGFIVDQTGYRPAPTAVKAVQDYPKPDNVAALRRFLGLVSYVRRFIRHVGDAESVLRKAIIVTDKKPSLHWTAPCDSAFETLRGAVTEQARLTRFNPALETAVLADASATGLGATLVQFTTDNHPLIVEYASRVLQGAETRYSNTERELLAAVWAVTKKFRPYLEGRTFQIGTDHKGLLGEIRLKESTHRIARFLIKLDPFQYTFVHIPGSKLAVPDALSRVVPPPQRPPLVALVGPPTIGPTSVDTTLEDRIKQEHISLGHANWKKVYAVLRPLMPNKNLRHSTRQVVRTCPQCLAFNPPSGHFSAPPQRTHIQGRQDLLMADFVGPFACTSKGDRYLLLAVDGFSRLGFCTPVPNTQSATAIKAFRQLFRRHGHWKRLTTDRDPTFKSHDFRRFLRQQNVRPHLAAPGHFEGNGICERLVRTLKTIVAKSKYSATDWPAAFLAALKSYNDTIHGAHGLVPRMVFFQEALDISDEVILERLHRPLPIKPHQAQWVPTVGDSVMFYPRRPSHLKHASGRHLLHRGLGPFQILRKLGFNRFILTDNISHVVASGFSLRRLPVSD